MQTKTNLSRLCLRQGAVALAAAVRLSVLAACAPLPQAVGGGDVDASPSMEAVFEENLNAVLQLIYSAPHAWGSAEDEPDALAEAVSGYLDAEAVDRTVEKLAGCRGLFEGSDNVLEVEDIELEYRPQSRRFDYTVTAHMSNSAVTEEEFPSQEWVFTGRAQVNEVGQISFLDPASDMWTRMGMLWAAMRMFGEKS